MSRSYKKTPVYQDQVRKKFGKKYANKAVRLHLKKNDLADGKSYRKVYETWDIRDYKFYCPFDDYVSNWENDCGYWSNHYTKEEVINDWEKTYHRK